MRFLVALAFIGLTACSSAQDDLKAEAEAAVLKQLKDPSSAQFSYGEGDPLIYPERGLVCAEVNARNAMGGYTGPQMFVYSRTGGVAFENDGTGLFPLLRRHCAEAIEGKR